MTRRRGYTATPEERQAARERDDRVSAEAERVLSDPHEVAKLIDRLLSSGIGPNLASYSLRNLALVISQCADRGIPVTDVAGMVTWNRRGRKITGPGLRIVAKRGEDKEDKAADADQPRGDGDQPAEGEDKPKRPRYRMTSVWAREQTHDAFDASEPDDPTPVPDAARVLIANVTEQLDRRGYRIVEVTADTDTGQASNIDHDARTVTVSADWTPRDRLLGLAMGLAQVLTLAAEARDARKLAG